MDRLMALKTFVLVADHQSFSEAARKLRVSATAASRAIADLEQSLGVVLLRRTTRSVGLTPEGSTFLARCRPLLEELDEAERALKGESEEPSGLLRVTAPVVFGRMHILPVVSDLMRRHPKMTIELALVDRVIRLVEEGVDVGVRIAELPDSALHAARLAQVRRVLVASPSYLAARGEPSEPADLTAHDLIFFSGSGAMMEWRFNASGRPAIRVEPRLSTNSLETSIDAAIDGLGIARVLSYQVQDHVRAGRLRYLLVAAEPQPIPISLLFQQNRRSRPSVAAFITACQAYCRTRSFE